MLTFAKYPFTKRVNKIWTTWNVFKEIRSIVPIFWLLLNVWCVWIHGDRSELMHLWKWSTEAQNWETALVFLKKLQVFMVIHDIPIFKRLLRRCAWCNWTFFTPKHRAEFGGVINWSGRLPIILNCTWPLSVNGSDTPDLENNKHFTVPWTLCYKCKRYLYLLHCHSTGMHSCIITADVVHAVESNKSLERKTEPSIWISFHNLSHNATYSLWMELNKEQLNSSWDPVCG